MEPKPRIQAKTLDELEASLKEFARLYAEVPAARRELREIVIQAKDRARFAARNAKAAAETRARKEEMLGWMLVWLDDPGMFAAWVSLRRGRLDGGA